MNTGSPRAFRARDRETCETGPWRATYDQAKQDAASRFPGNAVIDSASAHEVTIRPADGIGRLPDDKPDPGPFAVEVIATAEGIRRHTFAARYATFAEAHAKVIEWTASHAASQELEAPTYRVVRPEGAAPTVPAMQAITHILASCRGSVPDRILAASILHHVDAVQGHRAYVSSHIPTDPLDGWREAVQSAERSLDAAHEALATITEALRAREDREGGDPRVAVVTKALKCILPFTPNDEPAKAILAALDAAKEA